MDTDGTYGVAVFCCSSTGLFETFKLSTPVEPDVRIGTEAFLEPLTAALPHQTWCVFLVNRRFDRTLRGTPDRLIEIRRGEDDVHGKHDQGGWSQARFQRSVEKEVQDHVQNACDRLFESFRYVPFDKLLLGCPSELRGEVEQKLHPYLKERLVDRIDAEIEHENPDEVLERVRPAMEADERRGEASLIEKLSEQLGRNDRACNGVGSVLNALNEKRVDTLLIDPQFHTDGVVCADCGFLATQGKSCPVDGKKLAHRDDIVEEAIHSAVLQSANVREIHYHETDHALGAPMAALLRF
jgi:peptide chain release factor subunit 1